MPPQPPPLVPGFTVGVLRVEWSTRSYSIAGRKGLVWVAAITECFTGQTNCRHLDHGIANAALIGAVVQGPDGVVSRIAGIEAHCTFTLGVGAEIGILLVPLVEPRATTEEP